MAVAPRTLDHLVLCVTDLDRAKETYSALGFTLTPRATHPFGTCNHLAQFSGGNFLEIVALGDTSVIPAAEAEGQFSFGLRSQKFLEHRGEGMAMLVYPGQDSRADAQAFRAAGLDAYDPIDFARDARLPDGSTARVSFSLAHVTHSDMPDLAFFTCHQHAPEFFWKPDYQRHPNGAQRVVEVIMSAPDPLAFSDFFTKLMNCAVAVDEARHAIQAGPPTDRVSVLRPDHLQHRFPELAGTISTAVPGFVAFAVSVADLAPLRMICRQNGVPHREAEKSIIIPPAAAHGMVVEFVERINATAS